MECDAVVATVFETLTDPPNREGPPSTYPCDEHCVVAAPVHPDVAPSSNVETSTKSYNNEHGDGVTDGVGVADGVAEGVDDTHAPSP